MLVASVGLWVAAVAYEPFGFYAFVIMVLAALDLGSPNRTLDAESVSVTRKLSSQKLLVGDELVVEVFVLNKGLPIERFDLRDTPPGLAKVTKGYPRLVCQLGSGSVATLRYTLQFDQPGEHRFGVCKCKASSMFGLRESSKTLEVSSVVAVYPVMSHRTISTPRSKTYSWAGINLSKRKGGRTEFMQIRDYVFGDPLRQVNWKATARLGKTLVNEWLIERGVDCIVVVDLSFENVPRVADWSARPLIIQATYELLDALIRAGNRVGLLVLGSNLTKVKPGFGIKHLKVMVEHLIRCTEGSVWEIVYVEELLEMFFRDQYRRKGGTLFLVAAEVGQEGMRVIGSLTKKGFVCHTIYVDTLNDEVDALKRSTKVKIDSLERAYRIVEAERRWVQSQVSRFSSVKEWSPQGGFNEVFA